MHETPLPALSGPENAAERTVEIPSPGGPWRSASGDIADGYIFDDEIEAVRDLYCQASEETLSDEAIPHEVEALRRRGERAVLETLASLSDALRDELKDKDCDARLLGRHLRRHLRRVGGCAHLPERRRDGDVEGACV